MRKWIQTRLLFHLLHHHYYLAPTINRLGHTLIIRNIIVNEARSSFYSELILQKVWRQADRYISKCVRCGVIHSVVSDFGTPWTESCQAPLAMEFSRQECIPFSKGSSWPRDQTWVSYTAQSFLTIYVRYTHLSFFLSCIQGRHCHLSKFHVLVYCIGVFLSGLLHSV